MVVRARPRRGEAPPPFASSMRAGWLLAAALAGCFNPTGSDPSATGTGEPATAGTGTTGDATTAPGTATAAATTPDTTGPLPVACGSASDCPVDAPVCDPDSETCVQCRDGADCPADRPICQLPQKTCRKCDEHADCELACDLDLGTCFPPETVIAFTAPGVACSDACINSPPCCSIEHALLLARDTQAAHIAVFAGSGDDTMPVAVDATFAGRTIAILGTPPQSVLRAPGVGLTVNQMSVVGPAARLFVYGLQIVGGVGTQGVYTYSAPSVWLDATTIAGHQAAWAITAFASLVTLRRSFLMDNYGGPYAAAGTRLVLRDVIIGGSDPGPELVIASASVLDAVYATIVDDSTDKPGALVTCSEAAQLLFDNSLLLGLGGGVESTLCDGVTAVTRSATSPGLFFPLDSTSVELPDPTAAVPFESWVPPRDYLLREPAPTLAGIAVWQPAYPPTDIDGTLRPTVAGAPDYPGADIPN